MLSVLTQDSLKKARYVRSWINKRIVHTNLQLLYHCNFHCDICDYWRREFKERRQDRLSCSV